MHFYIKFYIYVLIEYLIGRLYIYIDTYIYLNGIG